eukprot:12747833-Alexandrium_andersonii.AAC.1
MTTYYVTYQYKEIMVDGILGVWAAVIPYPSLGGCATGDVNTFEKIKDYFEQPLLQPEVVGMRGAGEDARE